MKKNYTPIHVHSDCSNGVTNIDSITNYKEYIDYAKQCGMKAFGFSEHGCVFQWLHKKEEIEKASMKYLHCIEIYVTESLDEKIRDNYHCLLIAKNYEGVLEINRLSTCSFQRDDGHFYYMPRITFKELIQTSKNIIITTACLGGIINKGNHTIKKQFINFLAENRDRCFLEIQHHNDTEGEQKKYNQYLYCLSQEYNIPLVTGTDTHALNYEHLKGRQILQKAKNVRFAEEESWDLTFKTYDELVEAYKKQNALPMDVVLEAIENTNKIAAMVEEFEMDKTYKYPHLWEDSEKTFLSKIKEGIIKRGVDKYSNYQEYLDRIEEELQAYRHNGAIDFMLLMDDIISWCKTQEIHVGYGRGSCNGSVIAYLLGITEMDSIKHKLNFQRFMNVERVSLSDIDTDFPPSRIGEVKDYIFSKTGLYCSDIITFNTIADKGAIRDVGRAFGIPLDEVSEICNAVDDEKQYANMREQYIELFQCVDLVKGTIVSVGSHPCGTIVSPHDISDKLGLFTTSTSSYPISQINMKEVDSLNYVKLDLLKLDTIELINETCKLAHIDRLTPDNVDITDIKVWNEIRDDTTQIFQWEGQTGDAYIKQLLSDENIKKFQKIDPNVDRMTLFSIGNSAIRPAGASYRDDLAHGVIRKTGSEAIDKFLMNTFGYLVFQCQIIDFLHLYCGFTMGEADIVRRGFAKKTGTDKYIPIIKSGGYLTDNSEHYIKGYIATMEEKYGIDENKSENDIVAFIKVIEDASSYLFSLNHSQPYSYMGYVSGYLRTYYPLEFLTTAFNINQDKEEKTKALTAYSKKRGIIIKPPQFRHSKSGYFFDKDTNTIYKGICSIKFMNEAIANELGEISNDKFDTFIDLLEAIEHHTSVNSRQLEILIKLNFFKEFGGVHYLLNCYKTFDLLYDKKQISKEKAMTNHIDFEIIRDCARKETPKMFAQLDWKKLAIKMCSLIIDDGDSFKDIVSYQIECLGYIDIIDKKYSGYCVATDINVEYSPKIKLYALANGNIIPVKINKKIFSINPIKRGDIIKIESSYKKPKKKKVNGKWVDSIEKEWWIDKYKII